MLFIFFFYFFTPITIVSVCFSVSEKKKKKKRLFWIIGGLRVKKVKKHCFKQFRQTSKKCSKLMQDEMKNKQII